MEDVKENDDYKHDRPWDGLDITQIVSIDFGSFGFAASFCPINAPKKQRVVQNWSEIQASTELNKNLAALLIDKKTKETLSFGFEAAEMYRTAQKKKEDDQYMYFEHFKPYLYSNDHIRKNVPIIASDGVCTLPLSDLITKSLIAVMTHTLDYINNEQIKTKMNQIFWVISVPAIWDEMSKEMMKSCARKAGMLYFELGSEPIVSTFYVMNAEGKDFRLQPNDKIMIIDAGGGTIDMACVEVASSAFDLCELHHGDGIRCGGLDVDNRFIALLKELLPNEIVDQIEAKPAEWMDQRQQFILSKFSYPRNLDSYGGAWNVSFCPGINNLLPKKRKKNKDSSYKDLKSHIQNFEILLSNKKQTGCFKLGRSGLKINEQGWLWLHEEVLEKIVKFIKRLFENASLSGCESIIVVGGFANSNILISRLLAEFPNKKLFAPPQPHLAVVKGALYWICQRKRLKKTRARYSYGIAIDRKFSDQKDPESRRKRVIGIGSVVEKAFGALVVRNEEYEEKYKQTFEYWIPAGADHLEISLYASEDPLCRYVFEEDGSLPTEPGRKCFEVKKFVINIENVKKEKQRFELKLEYRKSGIGLYYIDPNNGNVEKIEVHSPVQAKMVK